MLAASGLGFTIWGIADSTNRAPALLTGGVLLIPGVIILAIPTRSERAYSKFSALPQGSTEEKSQKVAHGESSLSDLAEHGRSGRIMGGIVSIGVGAGFLVAGLVQSSTYSSSLYLTEAAILGAVGVAALLIRSRPEAAWENYKQRTASNDAFSTDFGVAIGPQGQPGAGLIVHF